MTEDDFLKRWSDERPMYEAWGKFVASSLVEGLRPLVSPVSTDVFIRIPVMPRLKSDGSFITKAFYRTEKNYTDPFAQITDKVGVRFVVLLGSQIPTVCRSVEMSNAWDWSKDKDYEEEIAKAPFEFRYQSVHYIVRCRGDRTLNGQSVVAGTPCEVQIRTLLQHAHSEMTHDTIYKPSVKGTPAMLRAAAKSMALIEATNDYFEELVKEIDAVVSANRKLSDDLADIYRVAIGKAPDPTRAEGLLNDAFATFSGDKPVERVNALLADKPFIKGKIAERSAHKHLFRQPSILLAYLAVATNSNDAVNAWPLTPDEIKPIYADLGVAMPQG
jgi:putative GTP pyrophosphokinase